MGILQLHSQIFQLPVLALPKAALFYQNVNGTMTFLPGGQKWSDDIFVGLNQFYKSGFVKIGLICI